MTTMMLDKFYVTKEGLEKVKAEYERLRDFKRQKTMGETPNLLHSEEANPEYLAFQEDISLLDAKIAEHENILQNAELISAPKGKEKQKVWLGATVTVDLGGEIDEFTIVGTLEADPVQKKISNQSPLGARLLGAIVGDVVEVKTELVNHVCKVLKVQY